MDRQRGRYSQQAAIQELNRRGLWGYVEPILTLGSAAFAEPVSGMMGLAALPYGADAATRAINRTQEALTYQPRTIEGQETLQAAGEFLQPVGDAFIGASEYLGDAAYDATGSPALGAAAYSVPTMALEALGLKGAKAASKGRAAYEFGDISDYNRGMNRTQFGGVGGITPQDAIAELEARGVPKSILDDSGVWLHGSPSQDLIDRLQSGAERGWRGNGNAYGDGIYITRSPKTANEFAGEAGQVLPLKHEAKLFAPSGDALDDATAAALNEWASTLNESDLARLASDIGSERKTLRLSDKTEAKQFFDTQKENWSYFGGMQRTKPSVSKDGDGFVIEYTDFNAKPDFSGKTKNEALNALIHVGGKPTGEALQRAGYDGVRYLPDEAVVFDSSKVKSYFER